MGRRSWTGLFFLDEAVALAAGHRPCFFCRRQAAEAFRDAWAQGRAAKLPRAAEMDAVLHGEAASSQLQARRTPLADGRAFRWTAHGYEGPIEIPRADALLTPPSTLGALRAGYRPVLHPSVDAMQPATADA